MRDVATRRRTVGLFLALALTAAGCVAAAPEPAPIETVDPDYTVILRPRRLVALDRDDDRFDLDITRRVPTTTVTAFHLTLTIRHGDQVLAARSRTVPATVSGQAAFRETSIVPPWPTLRYGRQTAIAPQWRFSGFVFEATVREHSPHGRIVYRLQDATVVLGVSRWGLYAAYWKAALAGGLLVALFCGAVSAFRAGRLRRAVVVFDLAALALLGLGSAAFSYWAILGFVPLALALVFVPPGRKARVVDAVRHTAAEAAQATWPQRLIASSPGLWVVSLTAWWLLWHYALVPALSFRMIDFRDFFGPLAAGYLTAAMLGSVGLHASLRRRRAAGRSCGPIVGAVWGGLGLSAVVRGFDWGTFYYSAGHVDDDFWMHAFYRENLGFARSPIVLGIVAVLVVGGAIAAWLLWLACRFAAASAGTTPVNPVHRPLGRGALWLSTAGAAVVVAAVHVPWRVSAAEPARDISDGIRLSVSALPEYKVLEPLVVRALRHDPEPPVLDAAFLAKLERAGLRLNTVDPAYPLLKTSVFLGPRRGGAHKPAVPPGTNVMVIMVEALSSALIDSRVHGVPGLTPNIEDFAAHAFTFRNLYSSDYPTVKGQLATLASFAFDHHGLSTTGNAGNPLASNYLLLSDVLKTRANYRVMHVQSDYASFGGTIGLLTRHRYDDVLSAEDAGLTSQARHPLTKRWGVFDEDTFSAVVRLLQRDAGRVPFLLTVATTDTHFPYATLHRHPGAHGNELLDAVHTTDKAFGVFWEYFKRSPWARNTVVLLTADHALPRRALRHGGTDTRESVFDFITGILYVPDGAAWAGRATDVTCTQLDLTPTLLDVLGIDTPNPFLGLSVFSDRPRYPLALSREIPTARLTAGERDAVRAIGWTDADQQRLMDLLRYLAVTDRIAPRPR